MPKKNYPKKHQWSRNEVIYIAFELGLFNTAQLGRFFGISRQRIAQIIKKMR